MNVLFTGSSSFTGFWFIKKLALAGHTVTATFRGDPERYDGIRKRRVERVLDLCDCRFDCSFGSDVFLDVVRADGPFDLLCHHAADVKDHKSPEFDALRAAQNNTQNLPALLTVLLDRSCAHVLLTGSVFEQDEGAGSCTAALSPYGLSKGLTAQYFAYYCRRAGVSLSKFVIPNPFGPFEEPRFTSYLARAWLGGEIARVATPDYVRDNIPVSLLASAYATFATEIMTKPGDHRLDPSGYRETQGEFTRRVARELEPHLGVPCPFELGEQTDFDESMVRTNTTPVLEREDLGWNEEEFWKELGGYYLSTLSTCAQR